MAGSFTTITAQTASSFDASIGVNIHPGYAGTEYANTDAWFSLLVDAGFEHVRTNWGVGDAANDAVIERLAAAGVKVMVTSDSLLRYNVSPQAAVDYLVAHPELAASISEIAGPNEVNANFANWQTVVPEFMKELYTAIKANPVTAHIQIVAPNFDEERNPTYAPQIGDISKYVDEGDIHGSNGGEAPTDAYYDTVIHSAQVLSGTTKPLVNTEGGYSYGTDSSAQGHPIPLTADAIETDVMHYFLENFAHGIVHSDVYQLLNQYPNDGWGDSFGLVDDSGKPTAAYNAIKALTTLLKDPGATEAQTPGQLTYALDGADANTRTLLLEKSDGTKWLAVWEQEQVFLYNTDDAHKGPVSNPPVPMTLELASAASGSIYLPDSGSTTAVSHFSDTTKITFDGGPKVVLIELDPASGPVASNPTPPASDPSPPASDPPASSPTPPATTPPVTTSPAPTTPSTGGSTGTDLAGAWHDAWQSYLATLQQASGTGAHNFHGFAATGSTGAWQNYLNEVKQGFWHGATATAPATAADTTGADHQSPDLAHAADAHSFMLGAFHGDYLWS